MVSDEVIYFRMPLVENGFAVWIAANLLDPVSDESLDVLICDGVQSLHDGLSEQSWSYDLEKDHSRNDEGLNGDNGDGVPVERLPQFNDTDSREDHSK